MQIYLDVEEIEMLISDLGLVESIAESSNDIESAILRKRLAEKISEQYETQKRAEEIYFNRD